MSREEILKELDKCFGLTDTGLKTRWCKCVLLCDWLLMHDKGEDRDDLYATRLCFCRFLTGLSKYVGGKIVDIQEYKDILCGFQAREELDMSRTTKKDIGFSEQIVLDMLSEIDGSNISVKIMDLDAVNMSRREYRQQLRESL